jgi:poly(A) polymerase
MASTNSRNLSSRKGLLARIFRGAGQIRPTEPLIAPRAEHGISRKNMAEEVLKVLYRLRNSGQKGYLVGGAVRDLLLGRKPKDYDVATDARPDEIKKLFVNSRLIGRRFRLAHIVFKGGRVVEVSTFRRSPEPPDADGEDAEERDLLIREDNTWGSAQEDAYRRDFTVNALFYNIADFSVIDYVGGLADLRGPGPHDPRGGVRRPPGI